MSDYWRCPHCAGTQEKTDQLKVFAAAKAAGSTVFGSVTSHAFPCGSCGQTVDFQQLAGGRFDVAPRASSEADDNSGVMGVIPAFIFGAVLGFMVLGSLIELVTHGGLTARIAGAVVGSIGGVAVSLSSRK